VAGRGDPSASDGSTVFGLPRLCHCEAVAIAITKPTDADLPSAKGEVAYSHYFLFITKRNDCSFHNPKVLCLFVLKHQTTT
jgi:hypothetical protein